MLVVPKNIQMDHVKFKQYTAKQSGLDGGFRVQKNSVGGLCLASGRLAPRRK